MSQCWDCPKRWVGTICMSLPVADLGPPQTGHGLFQVLPQVSNVLHCPHASRLGILSCRHKIWMIHRKSLDLHAHLHTRTPTQWGETGIWRREFLRDVLVSGRNDDQLSVTASQKKMKTYLSTADKWGSLMMTQPVGLHHAQFFWADMWLLCLIFFGGGGWDNHPTTIQFSTKKRSQG